MAKFPSQRKLHYKLEGIDDQTMTSLGYLNLPKDLSILNRRGYASTTRKGVPLIFRCKVDFFIQNYLGHLFDDDGSALSGAYAADMQATLKFTGVQNNWVVRNAAVKFHAAQRAAWKKAGVKRKHLGAYAHEIRYNLSGHGDTWLAPVDGDGNALSGGTWDQTQLMTESDSGGFSLKLVGTGVDERSVSATDSLNIAHSYMLSRATVPADSNLESSDIPADKSILNELLRPVAYSDADDNIIAEAQDQGDNPPYDVYSAANTNGDVTEGVELGRAVAGMGSAYGSMIVDIPFGLADCRGTIMQHSSHTDEPDGFMCVEVLDIFEMQG